MRFAIISIYPFPNGLAATNRIIAYSKGLIENGAKVDVFIPIPTYRYCSNKEEFCSNYGIFQEISYYYTIGRYSNKLKILRAFSILSGYRKIIGFISTCMMLYQKNKQQKFSCIIISSDLLLNIFIYSLFAKIIHSKSIFIFDEFPTPIRHGSKLKIPKWKEISYRIVLKHVNAYISISEKLKNYFNNLYPHKTHILPIIVDVSRFNLSLDIANEKANKYICYMGNMELSKDDVDNIIMAFSLIEKKYANLYLHLYGEPKYSTKKYLIDLVFSLKLQHKVIFMGKVASEEVPEILYKAHILVSSQPKTIRASGGFPTKLGEYMATGVPSLFTLVGENDRYVKDNVHLFFSEPNSPELYAEKLAFIMENYNYAKKIAENGKEFIKENFSQTVMGFKLIDFIKTI